MACDILCIPISIVALELAFNCSGHIIDRFRNFIKSENVEILLYLRDWIFGEKDNFLCFIVYEFAISCS